MQGDPLPTEERTPRIDARRNREAVIDAALELLAEQPNASMATIAERSGVGRTTVYRHFPHREDLVRALFGRGVDDARETGEEVIAESTLDPDDPLRHYLAEAQSDGGVRDDMPVQWILSMINSMAAGAMVELGSGRLDADEAGRLLGDAIERAFAA
jgi:AcrR family transcriptional regulator